MQDLTLYTTTPSVQLFNCNLGQVRVIIENGEPLFCLADLAYSLELTNPSKIKEQIEAEFDHPLPKFKLDRVTGIKRDGSPAIQQAEYSFINESELYFVLMRSRSAKGKPFRQWVTKEVLPSIRKQGSYNITQKPAIPQTYAEALLEAGRLALENEKLQAQAEANAPKVIACDRLLDSSDSLDFMAFSKIIGIGRSKLFSTLRDKSILLANNTPYQRYIDRGYFKVIESTFSKGNKISLYSKTTITPKGQVWLANKLKPNTKGTQC